MRQPCGWSQRIIWRDVNEKQMRLAIGRVLQPSYWSQCIIWRDVNEKQVRLAIERVLQPSHWSQCIIWRGTNAKQVYLQTIPPQAPYAPPVDNAGEHGGAVDMQS